MQEGRYKVVDPDQYEQITGIRGDVPDQIHIYPTDNEESHSVDEIWTSRQEGRTNTFDVETLSTLVASSAISSITP